MATVTAPARSRNLAEAHQRVRSPLERLRRFIRLYVSLEGAAVVGLYLTLWFWIGLVLDYGVFRLFHFDWVQETPWGVRCGVLVVLLSGLLAAVTLKVVTRLFREFRDAALALVLERRYPKILGDRLITAVELADPRKAAEAGYSPAMVQETIHEAAQRVEQLKIKEVFDWDRLMRRGILIGILAFGGYLIAGGIFCTANAVYGHGFTTAGFTQLHDVAGIWFERNILLQNVIWPRQAHLEYLDAPANDEYRIGKGDRGPTIRVRALKYVVAGAPTKKAVESYRAWLASRGINTDEQNQLVEQFRRKPAEGWRALSWFDLTPDLLGTSVPDIALPDDWKVREMRAGLTLDEIELNLDKSETHKTLAAETKEGMRNVLDQLEGRAADPALSRLLRKLEIPEEVLLVYRGNTTSSQTTMQRLADNEYTGQFGDLKETVTFWVQGLDYYTASRKVVVVDPPGLERLMREEERPAYLYYRLGGDANPAEMSGKKQRFERSQVSLQGGEVSRIDVPAGTNITLTATASKDLASVDVVPHKLQKSGIPFTASPPKMLDERTFSTRFENVRFEQNFLFRFRDTDGVVGQRQVVIVPSEDAPPKIREFAPDKIVRKVQGGYMVTIGARIPFLAEVDDDHGLNHVRYAYTISAAESGRLTRRASWPLLGGLSLTPTGQGFLPGMADLVYLLRLSTQKERKAPQAPVEYYPLPSFKKVLDTRPDDALQHPDTVREELARAKELPYRQLLRHFSLKADDWTQPELDPLASDLPLWKTNPGLKQTDPSRPQPRYQMQLWLEAVDNDLDSEKTKDGRPQPHVKVSEERYTFFLVSENELLTEIAKEEEQLHAKLDERYQGLLDTQNKLAQVNLDLSSSALKPEELGAMSARNDQVLEMLEKGQNTAREIHVDYSRILREMQANQVSQRILDRVAKTIVDPLKRIDRNFEDTRTAVTNFRKALDSKEIEASRAAGKDAKEEMLALTRALEKILASMQKMTDLNTLIAILVAIEKNETAQYETIKKLYEDEVDKLFDPGTGGNKPEGK
ncbi:MAG TPA: hypothetical protein VMG10_35195 [Gemmataceae bacterium]|nr:hypothetical protein [Gemmataceae bacterium]